MLLADHLDGQNLKQVQEYKTVGKPFQLAYTLLYNAALESNVYMTNATVNTNMLKPKFSTFCSYVVSPICIVTWFPQSFHVPARSVYPSGGEKKIDPLKRADPICGSVVVTPSVGGDTREQEGGFEGSGFYINFGLDDKKQLRESEQV